MAFHRKDGVTVSTPHPNPAPRGDLDLGLAHLGGFMTVDVGGKPVRVVDRLLLDGFHGPARDPGAAPAEIHQWERPAATCAWRQDEDGGTWWTACGEGWCLEDGRPSQHAVRFCHSCGRPVEEVPYSWGDEDEEEDGDGQ